MSRLIISLLIIVVVAGVGCWKKNNANVPKGQPKRKQNNEQMDAIDQALADQGPSGYQRQSNQPGRSNSNDSVSKQVEFQDIDLSKPVKGLEDIPPAPAGFTGEDQASDTEIPVDIQRRLRNSDEGWVSDVIELTTYPHPKVRYQAIDRLHEYLTKYEEVEPAVIVDALRAGMHDPVVENRICAINHLSGYGDTARNALPELIRIALAGDEAISNEAIDAIGDFGASATPVVPHLVALLDAHEGEFVYYTLITLQKIGPAGKDAIPTLAKKIDEEYVGDDYATTIAYMGGESVLLEKLTSGTQTERENAAEGMKYLKRHSPETVDALIKSVKGDSDLTRKSVEALGKVNPTNKKIVATLGPVTKRWDSYLRATGVKALGEIEPPLDDAVPYLLSAVKDSDKSVADAARKALNRFKISPGIKLELLIDQKINNSYTLTEINKELVSNSAEYYGLLRSYIASSQYNATRRAYAINLLTPLFNNEEFASDEIKKETIEFLTDLRRDSNPGSVRGEAARWIDAETDKELDEDDFKALLAGLADPNSRDLRESFAWRLVQNQRKEAIPVLVSSLSDSDSEVFGAMINVLGSYGKDATDAVPKLVEIAQDQDVDFFYNRVRAINALGEIGTKPKISLPPLTKLMKSDNDLGRRACVAVAKITTNNNLDETTAITRIVNILANSKADSYDKRDYLEALGVFGPKAKAAVGQIVPYLQVDHLRGDAADALGKIGPSAEHAVPRLIESAKNTNGDGRRIYDAIAKIGKHPDKFVEALPELVKDLDDIEYILETLDAYGPDAAAAAPVVADILESDDDLGEAYPAAQTLAILGSTDESVINKLKVAAAKEGTYVARGAIEALEKLVPADPIVVARKFNDVLHDEVAAQKDFYQSLGDNLDDVIIEALKKENADFRQSVFQSIGLALNNDQIIDLFNKLVTHQNKNVRMHAAVGLLDRGQYQPGLVEVAIEGLGTNEQWQYMQTVSSYGIGVLPKILDVMLDPEKDLDSRLAMLESIQNNSYRFRPVDVPAKLSKALTSDDLTTKRLAAIVHARLFVNDSAPLDTLLDSVNDESIDANLKKAAMSAMVLLRFQDKWPPAIGDVLLKEMSGANEEITDHAANLIRSVKLNSEQINQLISLLQDEKTTAQALSAIQYSQTDAAELVPAVIEVLKSDDDDHRSSAQYALESLRNVGVEQIVALFVDPNASESARVSAADILLDVESKHIQTVASQLKGILNDKNSKLKQVAAVLLCETDTPIEQLIPGLLGAFASEDYSVKYRLDSALEKSPQRVQQMRKELFAMFAPDKIKEKQDEDERESRVPLHQVVRHVGRLKNLTDAEVQTLVEAFLVLDDNERRTYAFNVGACQPFVEKVIGLYESANDDTKLKILDVFRNLDSKHREEFKSFAELLEKDIESENRNIAKNAAIALANLAPESDGLDETLVEFLFDKESNEIDYDVAESIYAIPIGKAGAEKLAGLLENSERKAYILNYVQYAKENAIVALPQIKKLLFDTETFGSANNVIASIGPEAKSVTPELLQMVQNAGRIGSVANTLGLIEAPSDQVAAAFRPNLEDKFLRYKTLEAIGWLKASGKELVPDLINELDDENADYVVTAANSLGSLELVASSAIEPLLNKFDHEHAAVRKACVAAIGRIGSDAETCVPQLMKAMEDSDRTVVSAAIVALQSYKADAAPALDKLISALEQDDLVDDALTCIGNIGPTANRAVPKLIDIANTVNSEDPYDWTRQSAVVSLGKIGPDAKTALPTLEKIYANADDEYLKPATAKALWQIDPATAERVGAEKPKDGN